MAVDGKINIENSGSVSEIDYRSIINRIEDTFFLFSPETGRALSWNIAFERVSGYTDDEIASLKAPDSYYSKSDLEKVKSCYNQSNNCSPVVLELDFITKEGIEIPFEYTFNFDFDQFGNQVMIAIGRNINERNRTRKLLQFQSDLLQEMKEAVYLISYPEGIIVYTNDEFCSLFGYEREEMLGKHVSIVNAPTIISPEETAIIIMNELGKSGEWQGEVQNIRKDGTLFWSFAKVKLINHPDFGKVLLSVHTDFTKKKEDEAQLKYREAELKALFECSPDIVAITDIEGKIFDVNRVIMGYRMADVIGSNINDFLSDKDKLEFGNAVKRAVQTGKTQFFEPAIVDSSGNMTYWFNRISPFKAISDEQKLVINFTDITQKVKAEKARQDSERFIDKMIENSALSTWIADSRGTCIRANKACLSFFGANEEEVIGKYNLFSDEEIMRKGFTSHLKSVFEKGEVVHIVIDYDFANVKKTSVKSPIHRTTKSIFTPVVNEKGKVTNVIVQTIDLTDIRRAEEAIKTSEEKFRAIFEQSQIAIEIYNREGKLLEVNPKTLELFGLDDQKHVLGFDLWKDPNLKDSTKEKLRMGFPVSYVAPFDFDLVKSANLYPTKRSGVIYIQVNAIPMILNSKVAGYIVEILEVTDRVLIQEKLKKEKENAVQINRQKTDFLINLSHDIRTPLNSIYGFSQILKEKNYPLEKRMELIDIILMNCNGLLNQIDDIIAVSKLESGLSYTATNLKFDLVEFLEGLNLQFQYKINTRKPELQYKGFNTESIGQLVVETDEQKLRQILLNLFENALKFTDSGGIEMHFFLGNNNILEFKVIDTGIGIDPDMHQFVFERFMRVDNPKNHGHGVGLHICKTFVNILGGEIEIDSETGKGACFKFTITPISVSFEKKISMKKPNPKQRSFFNRNILIVEDDPGNFLLLELMFEDSGANITWAKTGAEAMKAFHANDKINLVLIDLGLPDINGVDLVREMRILNSDIPLIVQSAHILDEIKKEVNNSGATGFISKPINLDDLEAILERTN